MCGIHAVVGVVVAGVVGLACNASAVLLVSCGVVACCHDGCVFAGLG